MSERRTAREVGSARRLGPRVEVLDRRELLAAGGIAGSLGPYVAPTGDGPRVTRAAYVVDAHAATQQLLIATLGTGLNRVLARSQALGNNPRAVLKEAVLGRPFVHAVLSDADTFTLFQAPALGALIGSQQVSGPLAAAATTAASTTTAGATAAAASPPVAFSLPGQASILNIGAATSLVQVAPSGGALGFVVEVPTSNLRILGAGPPTTGSVTIPRASIPAGFPIPDTSFIPIGSFAPTYQATAPILNEILSAGAPRLAPNAPNSVPGLRLVPNLLRHDVFPTAAARKGLLRSFRLAVQRGVFTLNDAQAAAVADGISRFAVQVRSMVAAGAFTPAVPPVPPALPARRLAGTLQVSVGALRELVDVAPALTGLQLPELGNFPGRLDVGYVFDRAGNYGIILTARGPLRNANPVPTPADVAAGDVRVSVSDAATIGALTGASVVEGVEIGALDSSALESSRTDAGVSVFSASAGDGLGLEYGTGIGYSTVIPLGNVRALILSAPPG